jgi:broad specificity phosphatase PhoE
MQPAQDEIWLIRHGETEWSITGQFSGRHDLPLTARGEEEAAGVAGNFRGHQFDLILCSPLRRAVRTCEIAGYLPAASLDADIQEWDYGDCTGMTEEQVRAICPGWTLWSGPVPNGEAIETIAARATRVVNRTRKMGGRVAIFSHGHFLRIFVTQWLGLPPQAGKHFALETGSVCILGGDAGIPAIRKWNLGGKLHSVQL